MAKIPVGATVAHAYRFAFGRFVDVLKVVWVAGVAAMVLGYLIQDRALAMDDAVAADQIARAGQLFIFLLPFYLAAALLFFLQLEGATRLALGLMPEPGPYYLRLGRPLWRLIGQHLLALLIIAGLAVAAGLVVGLLGGGFTAVTEGEPDIGTGFAIIIAGLLAYGALIYAAVRLFFFLAPVVIAEDAGARRSWTLGGGNFWRILGVQIAVMGPLLAVAVLLVLAFFGLPPMPDPATDPETARQMGRAWEASVNTGMVRHWYIVFPISFVFSVLMFGLGCGTQAHAYRAVTGG